MKNLDPIDRELDVLLDDRESIPSAVRLAANMIDRLGIWHQYSRNDHAWSCQDAARKRNRLGHKGIPLWDELKSFLGEYDDAAGGRHYFIAHCRGDRELNLAKVRAELQQPVGEIRRVTSDTAAAMGTSYGVVNPFWNDQSLIQIVDLELQRPIGVPGTVMTNVGDHTWAVEFEPTELFSKLSYCRWADIVEPNTEESDRLQWGVRDPTAIGILTGNPSDSGLELWTSINAHIRRLMASNSLGDVSMPTIVVVSTPQIGISMEMDRREVPLRNALLRSIDDLCAAGARLLAHPAHTTHFFTADIQTRAAANGARFISMAEATAAKLRQSGIKEIALLGTQYVTDFSQRWSVYKNAFEGLIVHQPSREGWDKIHNLGYEIQQHGPTPLSFNWMRDLLRTEVPSDCKHVVLAMTEFSPIVRQLKSKGRQGKILIDPIEIYAEEISRQYLGLVAG